MQAEDGFKHLLSVLYFLFIGLITLRKNLPKVENQMGLQLGLVGTDELHHTKQGR